MRHMARVMMDDMGLQGQCEGDVLIWIHQEALRKYIKLLLEGS